MKQANLMASFLVLLILVFLFISSPVLAEEYDPIPFEPDDTIDEIRYKIEANGYDFTVSENWLTRLSPWEKERLFSRHAPSSPRFRSAASDPGPLLKELGKRALPYSFDWRNYNGHSYIGGVGGANVGDQGTCGACYAFGACAAAEGTYNYTNGLYDGNCVNFSESFIAFCLRDYYSGFDGCGGSDYDYDELTALTNQGVTYEAYFPWTETDPGTCTHWSDPTVRFQSWHRIGCNDIEAIKTAMLIYGVIDVAVNSTSAFEAYSGGIYQDSQTSCSSSPCYYTPTNHIVSLVGWNDNGGDGYWILRNSWGSSWGEGGYMRIKYTSARVSCEACYLVYSSSGSSSESHIRSGDYNGDGKADIAIFRPASGLWSIRGITRVYFGSSSDLPVSGDYTGNGTTNIALFRPSTGMWAVRDFPTVGYTGRAYFGSSSDAPVPGDYNGNGTVQIAIFRESSGLWAADGMPRTYFGTNGDTPVPGDYDGDGTDDVAIFRDSIGLWAGPNIGRAYFGSSGDVPVPGDYTGYTPPAKANWAAAIFRPSTGLWTVLGLTRCYFGSSSDQAVPGDYNGDTYDDFAIFRSSSGLWGARNVTRVYFGSSGDIPVTR